MAKTRQINGNTLLSQAVSSLRQGKLRQTITILRKAPTKHGQNALVHYNLGLAYEAAKRYRHAMESYQRALSLDPTLLDAAVCQGYIFGLKGNFRKELNRYNEVLRRDPTHSTALYNKAVVLDDALGNPRSAIPFYLKVLKQPLSNSRKRAVLVRLAYCYLDTQQYNKAQHMLKQLAT